MNKTISFKVKPIKIKKKEKNKSNRKLKNFLFILSMIFIFGLIIVSSKTIISNRNAFFGSNVNITTDSYLTLTAKNFTVLNLTTSAPIQIMGIDAESKPSIGFSSYDQATNMFRPVAWIVAHYNLTDGSRHSHLSFETLDNSSGIPVLNSKFEIAYGGNLTRGYVGVRTADLEISNNSYIYFGKNTATGDNSQNSNIGYQDTLNALTFTSPQYRFNGGTLFVNSQSIYLNTTTSKSITLDRDDSSSDILSLIFARTGTSRWAIRNTNDNTDDLYIRDAVQNKNVLQFTTHAVPTVTVVNQSMLIIAPNATTMSCNSANTGAVYYDGSTFSHYGCNSTTWNALY